MHNFFTSDLFFVHAAGAVVAFRTAAAVVPAWARQLLLTLISVYFLAWLANARAVAPLLIVYLVAALAVGQLLLMMAPKARAWVLGGGCTVCVAILLVFKYQHVLESLAILKSTLAGFHALEWIGLSYLTFRTLDYFISMRPERIARGQTAGWLYGCSYLLFFPAYISGPINRFQPYLTQQAGGCTPITLARARANLLRIALGIMKILLLGRLAYSFSVIGPEFPGMDAVDFGTLAMSLYAFYLYYYFDFSGYCDVAIALADFFEVRLPENFNYPFIAADPQDFWNRWHISLTHWLRDHLFFRMLRFFTLRLPIVPQLAALMVSSFLTLAVMGAWHGSTLNWFLYGCYHGTALCLRLVYQQIMENTCPDFYERLRANRAYRCLGIVLTFNYVAWGLLLTLPLSSLHALLLRLFG
jgi:D-alanyl-lipoteichoic acid acyltransferase DltB (MBOAT superfamily)